MAHPPLGTLRSPRKRALEMGTEASKFSAPDDHYDAAAGTPRGMGGGVYKDVAEELPEATKLPTGSLPQAPDPSPFTLKGA